MKGANLPNITRMPHAIDALLLPSKIASLVPNMRLFEHNKHDFVSCNKRLKMYLGFPGPHFIHEVLFHLQVVLALFVVSSDASIQKAASSSQV